MSTMACVRLSDANRNLGFIRIQSEHPQSESDTVITRGRVLGGLEPSRAFGDSRYKWPVGMAEKLAAAFHVSTPLPLKIDS